MKRIILIYLSVVLSLTLLHAQEYKKYFPTGMKWKEVIAEPDYLPLDTTYSSLYEIGEDTVVRGINCKKVFINKAPIKLWVYEEGQKVWIITEDYPEPILIYDFNWHDAFPVYFEQLKFLETSEKEIEKVYINQDDIKSVIHNGFQQEYILNYEGTIIRNIGRVSDLYRNGCLLGYIIEEPIIPGNIYNKVLWIIRNGEEIFRSEAAEEWIINIPNAISYNYSNTSVNSKWHDLSGRRISVTSASSVPSVLPKGVYVRDGKKVVVK